MSGTIYATADGQKPLSAARVLMTDATGTTFTAETNCAGNFFVRAETWRPTFPVYTTVKWGDQSQPMASPIHREPSCGACHGQTASPSSAGPIFVWGDAGPPPPDDLPGGCK